MPDARDFIDLARYPLDLPRSETYLGLIRWVRSSLELDGCAVLDGFVPFGRLPDLVAEADAAAPNGHRSRNRTNVYFTRDDESLPPDHPKRRFFDRSNAFIPADNFGSGSILRALYDWPHFTPFIQAALGEARFYPYADPLADVIVNMANEGGGFPWHFDTNNYTVTLAIQNAETGGAFEYAPNIRRDSENFDAVTAVLDGRSDRVKTLYLKPGDLQIFKGRYSLHRVTPLTGRTPRYVAIFSYVEEPGMVATPERCRQLYGKALPIHYERAGLRRDDYLD
jgi:hypothetical protein